MIRFVFFDYDGVLTTDRTGSLTTSRFISAAASIPIERVRAAFAVYQRDLTLGHTTHQEVWPKICSLLGVELPLEILQAAFDSTPINRRMMDVAQRLRAVCGVGIITDNKADRMRRLRQLHGLDDVFDPIVVSADVGCSKDSGSIFHLALERAGVRGAECVFIDNNSENAAVARSAGLHGIYFDDALSDVGALETTLRVEFGLSIQSAI